MKLTVIGSGGAIINKKRKEPSFLLETQSKKLLFDCGCGSMTGLADLNFDINNLDHLFITHAHADHLGELIFVFQSIIAQAAYFPNQARKKPLYLHGYKGFQKDVSQLMKIMNPEYRDFYPLTFYEYEGETREVDNLVIKSASVQHVPQYFPSVAFRLESEGKTFVYSGDCGFNENIIKLAQGANMLIIDSSVPPQAFQKHGAYPNHLSPFEIGQIAEKAKPQQVVLYHLYDLSTDEEIITEIRKNYQGKVIIPQDNQQIEI